jgi:DNA-directed RNA polymerase specialized sigma24 family protein
MAIDSLQVMHDAATQVFAHFAEARQADRAKKPAAAQAARNQAGRLLFQVFGRWMDSFFERKGVPSDEAQDLTQDTMLKLSAYANDVKANGFALICRARRSIFIDYLKRRQAGKRKVGTAQSGEMSAELQLDDDSWDALSESVADERIPFELVDCVQRKLSVFRQVAGVRADVLELRATGLSAREIAGVLFDKAEADITKREEANVRARIYDMKDQVQSLFAECKD